METAIMLQTTAILCIIAWAVHFFMSFLKTENFLKVSIIFVLTVSYPNPTICTDAPETNSIPIYNLIFILC